MIAATEIAGAMDAGESLKSESPAERPELEQQSGLEQSENASNPSALAAGEEGATDSGTVMERQIRRARPPRRMNQTCRYRN